MDAVIEKLKLLRLKNCAQNLADVLDQAARENLSILQAIDRLLEIELACRNKARIILRFKQSKLGEKTTIDQFDFNHHESRRKYKTRILSLIDLGFIQNKKISFLSVILEQVRLFYPDALPMLPPRQGSKHFLQQPWI